MGTVEEQTVRFVHVCDVCNALVIADFSDPPTEWLGVGTRSADTGLFDLELCDACADIAALVMLESKRTADNAGLPWSPGNYYAGDVAIAASWDNKKCPECGEPWSKRDPLRHSPSLGKWVHEDCA